MNFTFFSSPPIKRDITNNRILTSIKAMPSKNVNADSTNNFSLSRNTFIETYDASMSSLAVLAKKKYLGNRDASVVAQNRRVNQIGNGSLNALGKNIALSCSYDSNSRFQALARVRGSGTVVVPKISKKYVKQAEINALTEKKAKTIQYNQNILLLCTSNQTSGLILSEFQTLQLYYPELLYDGYIDFTKINTAGYSTYTIQYYEYYIGGTNNSQVYTIYQGDDLSIENYSVVVMFADERNITSKTIYGNNLGKNLNRYLSDGGNLILGNYVWKNNYDGGGYSIQIPGFQYGYSAYPYSRGYTVASQNLSDVVFTQSHPILQFVDPHVYLSPQNVITNIDLNAGAFNIVTTENGVPFVTVFSNILTGSRTVGINGFLGAISPDTTIHEFAKILYNAIHWCMKKLN
jgi:hypothetical protein